MSRIERYLLWFFVVWALVLAAVANWHRLNSDLPAAPARTREDLLPHFQHRIHVLEERVKDLEERNHK